MRLLEIKVPCVAAGNPPLRRRQSLNGNPNSQSHPKLAPPDPAVGRMRYGAKSATWRLPGRRARCSAGKPDVPGRRSAVNMVPVWWRLSDLVPTQPGKELSCLSSNQQAKDRRKPAVREPSPQKRAPRNVVMIHPKSRPDRPALAPHWLLLISLCALLGCEPDQRSVGDVLSHRILPPQDARVPRTIPPFREPASRSSVTSRPAIIQSDTSTEASLNDGGLRASASQAPASQPAKVLTLAEAIKTAFREQPRLRVYLETLNQAQRTKEIAFAPYLPTLAGGYGVGTYHLNDTFDGVQLLRTVGVHDSHALQFADLRLQWLICDFGRRLGLYNQAGINV